MAENITVPRSVRLQHAMTGTPLDERTRDQLEEIAELARVEVKGTGKDGYVTADDLRAAIRGAAAPVTTRPEAGDSEEG